LDKSILNLVIVFEFYLIITTPSILITHSLAKLHQGLINYIKIKATEICSFAILI
jgi:hypothetical protein